MVATIVLKPPPIFCRRETGLRTLNVNASNVVIPKYLMTSMSIRLVTTGTCLAFLVGCAITPHRVGGVEYGPAARSLREARSTRVPVERRAADYLQVAAISAPMLDNGSHPTTARDSYNTAAAELTILLRSSEGGRLWNHPLLLNNGSETYHLHFQPAGYGVWAPDYFTAFKLPAEIERKRPKILNIQNGVGGALVGVRAVSPRENFAPFKGITAPVTATLDFRGTGVTLALRRPAKQPTAKVEGKVRPLAADYTAAIAYYRPPSNFLAKKLMATFRPGRYAEKMGLYFLQPYDPDRIPIVFVHGLSSSPFMWSETINELQADPEVCARYQFWVFAYPTGYPPLYSALRLREELAKVDKLYPRHRSYVLVGHSLGGILAHAQVVTVTPAMWEQNVGEPAKEVLGRTATSSLLYRSLIFHVNPRVKRVVFICTPHRGSETALSGLGRFGRSLIALPLAMTSIFRESLTDVDLTQFTGSARRLPNSVSGLSPKNPTLKIVNSAKITAPYHSIIGDRGKGDTPNSTDGVVPYWSSHLDGAKSEFIVPGPHGSQNLRQTIAELDRILRLHLRANGASRAAVAQTGH
jgi:pimeloyl-ACP methyl ester carboxylesterase